MTPELPRGTVSVCSVDDRPVLFELHRAVYPHATIADAVADTRDETLKARAWIAYRDDQGEIRVALFIQADGLVCLLAKPEECDSPVVRHGFLMLVREAWAALAPYNVRSMTLLHGALLQPLAKVLECGGFVSREVAVVRTLHFDEAGKVAIVN